MSILNTEVLGEMGPNDYRYVIVEIDMEHEDKLYHLKRKATFSRKYPKYVAKQDLEKLTISIKSSKGGATTLYDNDGDSNGKNKSIVDEIVNELLPNSLSTYFLFDGERWNDEKNKKNDIKESIYTIMGISPIRLMKLHLNELGTYGKNGVIKQFKSKLTGSGDEFNKLNELNEAHMKKIEVSEKKINEARKNKEYYRDKINELESILNANKTIELDQQRAKLLEKDIEANERNMEIYYKDIITAFSKSYTYFAAPLLEDIIEILKKVDLEGKDIPNVTDNTIDYIIEVGQCLCGHKVLKDSYEYNELLKLKEVIPPMKIGTLVGNYQKELKSWELNSAEVYTTIKEKADLFQGEKYALIDNENDLEKLNKKIDGKINFQQERLKLQTNKKKEREEEEIIRIETNNVKEYKEKLIQIEDEISELHDKSIRNAQIERSIEYAEKLYEEACKIYKKNELSILNELNYIIKKNFQFMFNEKEKYAKLGDDYEIRLYYRRVNNMDDYSEMEASGLSEGEKIAKNFVFIVSIMELANKKRNDKEYMAQTLPLVLDGPFSKLSSVNISLIAQVLPTTADQVIIFMLDKDWEHCNLEKYTGAKYRVSKEKDQNYATIKKIY